MEPETVDLSRYPVCDFDPYLIQFSEGIGIRWYGLAYIMGFVVAYLLLRLYHKRGRIDFNADEQLNLMTAIILGTFVGGRLGYMLLYTPGALVDNPLSLFKVWEGGMASHGGFVGICVGMWWFARRQKTSFWNIADICVTLGPAGVFFGRIANFINGELWGKVTDVSWAWIFPKSVEEGPLLPRHPSQLYEAALEGLFLFIYLQLRWWKSDPKTRSPGILSGEFLVLYSIGRIICEVYRQPDGGEITLILSLSRGTFYSLITLLAGVFIIAWALWSKKRPLAEE